MTPLCSSCGEEYGAGYSVPASPTPGVCASCSEEDLAVLSDPPLDGPFEEGARVRYIGQDNPTGGAQPEGTVTDRAQDADDVWLYWVLWDDGRGNGRPMTGNVLEPA